MTKDDLVSKDTALKMAIEALENIDKWLLAIGQQGLRDYDYDALQACKEALADNPFCKHGVPRGVCTLGEKDCD